MIYYGCAGFGQILRSFSLNRPHYSPQTIEKSVSNRHNLVTITNLGQPPSVVFHAVLVLLRAFRARVTFSRILSTVAVQTKGFGAALWYLMYSSMA